MNRYRHVITVLVATAAAVAVSSCTFLPANDSRNSSNESTVNKPDIAPVQVIANGLDAPWALAVLPDGNLLLTERNGAIRLIDAEEGLVAEPLAVISDVAVRGEGGLLGLALHPDFKSNNLLYIYHTYQDGPLLKNKVVRFRLDGSLLTDEKTIISNIPGANIHNGGRIKFGPDNKLYITTGDAASPELAQDKNSLAGKILRLNGDGSIPADNPFQDSPVYSMGHRNPQGLAWDSSGRLWATEHGSSAYDEVNKITSGANYGWPQIRGDAEAAGMVTPILHSGTDTWAPSGSAFFEDNLFFVGLRGQALFQAKIEGDTATLKKHFSGKFGRLRDITVGADGMLYLITNNRDGRGSPEVTDDIVLRIDPNEF